MLARFYSSHRSSLFKYFSKLMKRNYNILTIIIDNFFKIFFLYCILFKFEKSSAHNN